MFWLRWCGRCWGGGVDGRFEPGSCGWSGVMSVCVVSLDSLC